MTNNTLKEYYVKLNEAWNNALNVLGAINQSLTSNSTNIQVNLTSGDSTETYIIPSFLHLENKLETLSNNFDSIFDLPKSGEAWLTVNENSSTFKVELVRTGISPVSPSFKQDDIFAATKENNFLKDLVSPKTYLKVNIDNLPDNIEKIFLKKIVFSDLTFYDSAYNKNPRSYDDLKSALYTIRKNVDYVEYDSVIDLPIKRDRYNSEFRIEFVDNTKTFVDPTTNNYSYRITVNTLKYTDAEDSSIEFSLKVGDKLCLGNNSTIFQVQEIYNSSNEIVIKEIIGHSVLQDIDENPSMVLGVYNNDFTDYHYIEIPLEEDPYICVVLSTLQNNVRSNMSRPLFVNLHTVYMKDENNNYIYDEYGNRMTYMQYYEKNCTNIGDLILGLTQEAYPQLTSISPYALENLQEDAAIKGLVSSSINAETILKVLPINEHLINNETADEIISMHAQKNEITNQINTLNDQISGLNEQLLTTDFTQNKSLTQVSIKQDLNSLYAEKTVLQKQLISLVENININSASIKGYELKYRIRGVTEVEQLENHLTSVYSDKVQIIGIDVEYKYKSLNKTTSTLTTINNNVFTDWNKYTTIDKERLIKFSAGGNYYLEFDNYSSITNIIKWNQIDIPIVADEDVVIRIRYKYNLGQPFLDVYTPWSDEITVVFPVEYKDAVNVNTVISENHDDIITAKFNKELIDAGYADHLNDGIIDGAKKFFHDANNVYSGYSTPENNLMSVKDKMDELIESIAKYQSMLESELQQKYEIYLQYDDKTVKLLPNIENEISIYNSDHLIESFVKKKLNLVITNIGEVPVKLYSIFPGGISTPLIFSNDQFYEKRLIDYERVPIIVDSVQHYQTMGQWIYFRQNNPWTGRNIYFDSYSQNRYDWLANNETGCVWNSTDASVLMKKNYNQVLFGWRRRDTGSDTYFTNTQWKGLLYDKRTNIFEVRENIEEQLDFESIVNRYQNIPDDKIDSFFMYENVNNNYIMRYEDIYYNEDGISYYLDEEANINEFISHHNVGGNFKNDTDFTGAFLFPEFDAMSNILTDGSIGGYTEIPTGGEIIVPLTLEFFLNADLTEVKKGVNFDIKPSSFNEPVHYMLTVNCLYDYTASGNVLGNTSLNDESIDY